MTITQHFIVNRWNYIQLAIIAISIEIFLNVIGFQYDRTANNPLWLKRMHEIMHHYCSIRTENEFLQWISQFVKGTNYITVFSPDENREYAKNCVVTPWNMFHFSSHFILAFFYPSCWISIFLVSFTYEIYEYIRFRCHDISDIFYNVMGILLGLWSRKQWDRVWYQK